MDGRGRIILCRFEIMDGISVPEVHREKVDFEVDAENLL
jgi:hypothetical protein